MKVEKWEQNKERKLQKVIICDLKKNGAKPESKKV